MNFISFSQIKFRAIEAIEKHSLYEKISRSG